MIKSFTLRSNMTNVKEIVLNLIFNEYCKFLKDKTNLELKEGYFWLDNQIIKAFDKQGNIHKLYRLVVDDNLNVSYKICKNYSNINDIDIESWQETAKRLEVLIREREREFGFNF